MWRAPCTAVQRESEIVCKEMISDDMSIQSQTTPSLPLGAQFQEVEGKFLESIIWNEENIFTTTIYLCQFYHYSSFFVNSESELVVVVVEIHCLSVYLFAWFYGLLFPFFLSLVSWCLVDYGEGRMNM